MLNFGSMFDLSQLRVPIPVDPDRPDEGTQVIDGTMVLSRLWEVTNHLAAIREATEQTETRTTSSRRFISVPPERLIPSDYNVFAFDPVPQGAVHQVTQFTLATNQENGYPDYVYADFFRNSPVPSNYICQLAYDGAWKTLPNAVNFASPVVLQQGEFIVVRMLRSDDPSTATPVCVTMDYREFTTGPKIIEH